MKNDLHPLNFKKVRSFLKWAGSKYQSLEVIVPKLPLAKVLMEPFVGSGVIFLNTNYEYYILNDANVDLINLYKTLQQHGEEFINFCKKFFSRDNNQSVQYYNFREQFNHTSDDLVLRAALFLYLNKHGYNGLCRFNRSNKFNVPFGKHNNITFPEHLMRKFYLKSHRAKFFARDFLEILSQAGTDTVVYCDPPYVPLSKTANFVNYEAVGFDFMNQVRLAEKAEELALQEVPVVISNHFTRWTKQLYSHASEIMTFKIRRMISCKINSRKLVREILAVY